MLVGFLPPLLYATAIRGVAGRTSGATGWPSSRSRSGLVLCHDVRHRCGVWWCCPVAFAVAVAVGAVVAPPDAVAATAVARRVGMPRRMVTILEGEGMVNDATALVALRTAIAARAWRFDLGASG